MANFLRYKGTTTLPVDPPIEPTDPDGALGPTVSIAPTLGGVAMENCLLYIIDGVYNCTLTPKILRPFVSRQWVVGGVDVPGANDPIYWVTGADVGKAIRCREIVLDAAGMTITTTSDTTIAVADTRTVVDMVATFGLKAVKATGTINAGTNQLVLTTGGGALFAQGDQIIIPVGFEPGAGMRGTLGVGGTWPALRYADAAARNADTSKASGTFAWIETDGSIHSFNGSTWSPYSTTDYYHAKAQPLALVATILSKAGDTLTLSVQAQATATSADVYFDNYPKLNGGQLNGSNNPTNWNKVFAFPAGAFAFSDKMQVDLQRDCWIKGAGRTLTKLVSPPGTPCFQMRLEQCQRTRASDFEVVGNVRDNGFGLKRSTQNNQDRANSFTRSLWFRSGSGNYCRDVKLSNTWIAISYDFASYGWVQNCDVHSDDGHHVYVQWQIMMADCFRCGAVDVSVTSAFMFGGIETFRSEDVKFFRPVLVNAGVSANTAGNFVFDRPVMTITNLSQKNATFWQPTGAPLINLNANIGSTSSQGLDLCELGGEVNNPTIIMQGFINADKQLYAAGIIIAPNYKKADGSPNVIVRGGYPGNPGAGGLIQLPDYQTPINGKPDSNGPVAVKSDGTASVVGIRAKGQAKTPVGTQYNNIGFTSQTVPTGYVYDSVADTIRAGFQSGNMTNAAFEAL